MSARPRPISQWLAASCIAAGISLLVASSAGATTLSQTSTALNPSSTFGCENSSSTREESFYRAFDLSGDYGITTPFTVSSVTFGIDSATNDGPADDGQPLTVKLHTLSGALMLANLTQIASQTIDVENSDAGTLKAVPITATVTDPASQDLVAEIFSPDGNGASDHFYIGANGDPETRPSYLRAPDCAFSEPSTTTSAGFPNTHFVIQLDGTTDTTPSSQPPQSPPPQSLPAQGQPAKSKCKHKHKRSASAAKKKRCKKRKR